MKPTAAPQPPALAVPAVKPLYQGIKQLLEQARAQVVVQVNQALRLRYCRAGQGLRTQVLQGERAAYSAGVPKALAWRITRDYGSGFSHLGLTRVAQLYDSLPDDQKVATLSHQLSWSHFVRLLSFGRAAVAVARRTTFESWAVRAFAALRPRSKHAYAGASGE